MKAPTHTTRRKPAGRSLRALLLRACACGFAVYFLFILMTLAPVSRAAQSGRKRPEPTPTPQTTGTQRPRRAATTTTHPPAADQPGQPATPDEPRGTPAPTPTPVLTNDPDTGQPVEIDPDEVIRVNSNLVPIPASVIDDSGRAVTDLQVKDFELRIDGQPKPIGDLSRAETPVRLALLFDNSYSLRTARELEKQSAMRFFRTVMRPSDQAAIYSVSTEPILEQPLTSDVNRLVHIIERYGEPEGATALLDTIVEAADYLKPQMGRKVIVIVSDGVDTVSNTEFNETVRRVQAADVQVYAVQNSISENANLRDLTAERRMQEITAQTGGAVFVPKTTNDLPAAFAQISADLAQQYILSYYPDDDRRDARFRIISLRVTTRPNMRIRARRGYYPRKEQLTSTPNSTYNPSAPSASDVNVMTTATSTKPANNAPAQTTPPVRTSVPAVGPSYGSKNLNPDDDVMSRRVAPTTDSNSAAASNGNALPANDNAVSSASVDNETKREAASPPSVAPAVERPPESRIEVASATSPPAPVATPEPSPAPNNQPAAEPTPTPKASTPEPKPTQTTAAKNQATTSANTAQASGSLKVSGGVLNGRAIRLPKPTYPETAQRMHAVGAVNVEVTIDENGKVIEAHAVSGHTLLRAAAVAAAKQAVFTPTVLSGKSVQVTGVIIYNFSQ
jgi:Ca-activated chloride channel family protein